MASKKPAKPLASQPKQTILDPSIYGQTIKFMGTKDSQCACAKCGRAIVRGMVRFLGDKYYCSVTCVAPTKQEDSSDN